MNLYITIIFISIGFLGSCRSQPSLPDVQEMALIEFSEREFDYGEISCRGDGRAEFNFTNNSQQPLVINNVRTSCGCAVPEWSQHPVKPGENGVIVVQYNTNITGKFRKSITVYSNAANSPSLLFVRGNVLPSIAQ